MDAINSSSSADEFHANYQLGDELAQGLSGTVHTCRPVDRIRGKHQVSDLAVKIIDLHTDLASVEVLRDYARCEIDILKAVRGPNTILSFQEAFETDSFFFIITELCPHGDLFSLTSGILTLSESRTYSVMRQVMSALSHIHSLFIVHRDIKPENIFVFSRRPLQVKVGDFGHAATIESDTELRDIMGTPTYFAPEQIRLTQPIPAVEGYGRPVDVWACGVVMYMLLIGHEPFHHNLSAVRRRRVLKGRYGKDNVLWESVSAQTKEVIDKMLTVDPERRETAEVLLVFISRPQPFRKTSMDEECHKRLSRRRFRALVFVIMGLNRLRRLRGLVIGKDMFRDDPYANKILSKWINEVTYYLYGHWVKREDHGTVQDLYRNDLQRASSNATPLEIASPTSVAVALPSPVFAAGAGEPLR